MILVTGATGSLGARLTRALVQRGQQVAILRRPDDPIDALDDAAAKVEHRLGDVRDYESVRAAMRDVSCVFHLAGLPPGVGRPLSSLTTAGGEMYEVHVRGTENVARAALEAGVTRLVHTSTAAAIGLPQAGTVATEDFPFGAARDDYMLTKHLAEEVLASFAERGLETVILNPTLVMAAGNYGLARIVMLIKEAKIPAYPGGGLGLTTAPDVVDAHLKAMSRGVPGRRYIVNTVNLTYRELFRAIARVVGSPAPRWPVPDWLLRGLGRLGSMTAGRGRRPALNREIASLLTGTHYYDQSRAVAELGISQSPIEIAICEVYEWCKGLAAGQRRQLLQGAF